MCIRLLDAFMPSIAVWAPSRRRDIGFLARLRLIKSDTSAAYYFHARGWVRQGGFVLPEAIFCAAILCFYIWERRLLPFLDDLKRLQGEGKEPGLFATVLDDFTVIVGLTCVVCKLQTTRSISVKTVKVRTAICNYTEISSHCNLTDEHVVITLLTLKGEESRVQH
jgi:hypothetical protein